MGDRSALGAGPFGLALHDAGPLDRTSEEHPEEQYRSTTLLWLRRLFDLKRTWVGMGVVFWVFRVLWTANTEDQGRHSPSTTWFSAEKQKKTVFVCENPKGH